MRGAGSSPRATSPPFATANRVSIAGLVLIRQRPGSAKGVVFITLEDETGVANLVVWPDVFAKQRKIVMGARLMAVRGVVQSEEGVIHVVARGLEDDTAHAAASERGHHRGAALPRRCARRHAPAARPPSAGCGGHPEVAGIFIDFRHCERSEAIQFLCFGWIAASPTLLAKTIKGEGYPSTPRASETARRAHSSERNLNAPMAPQIAANWAHMKRILTGLALLGCASAAGGGADRGALDQPQA